MRAWQRGHGSGGHTPEGSPAWTCQEGPQGAWAAAWERSPRLSEHVPLHPEAGPGQPPTPPPPATSS